MIRATPANPMLEFGLVNCGVLNALNASARDFRLKPGRKAVDAGVPIPTVNDGFAGRAPDLGALEVGRPEPKYGPG